jgi:hypothetical protein
MKPGAAWGIGVYVFYAGFVVFTLALVLYASMQHVELTEPDYYRQELAYQQRIDQLNRTADLDGPLQVTYDRRSESLHLTYPAAALPSGGEVALFRPSNSRLDHRYPAAADSTGRKRIAVGPACQGLWRVRVDWRDTVTTYYAERILILE